MSLIRSTLLAVSALVVCCSAPALFSAATSPISFLLKPIGFTLENGEKAKRHLPATMAGGVAVFDYNQDGRPDIFFTNGAEMETLKKEDSKYSNRLFRNDGKGNFTDVTKEAGLEGAGFDIGVAVGDYDNDGYPDLFVAGVGRSTLYHNNGNGTFTDVSAKAGFNKPDPQYGAMFAVAAAWVDVNNDGLLDLFVANYVQWDYKTDPPCSYTGLSEYCHPNMYKGLPNQLFLNRGNGKFEDVSEQWGIRSHIGKGMGVGVADFDLDGRPDIFVANDTYYNSLFHNTGSKFEEDALEKGVALVEDGNFISGMGLDFRDYNNDGYPDITFVALTTHTFPLFRNNEGKDFREVTGPSGLRQQSLPMAAFGVGMFDLDNDGWKDLFVTRGDVLSLPVYHNDIDQPNTVFRNLGAGGTFQAYTSEAGLAAQTGRHRGCAFGDLDGDGRIDVVATALGKPAELWMNNSQASGHWLNVALQGTKSNRDGIGARVKVVSPQVGPQYNHMTTSACYASSSAGPVHFGLGPDDHATSLEIHWPSGTVQTLSNVAADRVLTVKESPK